MLQIKHLKKQFGTFTLECSMQVKPGQVTGLIGKNGAGKSTTFKSVLGLITPDAGEIQLFGKARADLSTKDMQKIGVVLSDSGFSTYLNIRDISCILEGMYPAFDKNKFEQQCRQAELPLDRRIKEFSTGMKAKLKVLAAVSHGASLLILDEPTVGLDVMARDEILNMLRTYMEEDENRSILVSSHISSDLEQLCDDIYMIHDGKVILHEETDVLLDQYALLKLSLQQYESIDKRYLLKKRTEHYGVSCLTKERQYYAENYPDVVMEKGNIDEVIVMMAGGKQV